MFTAVSSDLLKEKYYRVKHKSGLLVYVFPKQLSVSYAVIATKFGSIDNCFKVGDDKEFTRVPDGVAHFLEHKMFENEDGEDTFVKFARTGADANAFTSFKDTAYLFSCTENLYESLEILLRSTFSPHFTDENVSKEQGIIAQEIRMGDDDPGNMLFYDVLSCLYEKSSLKLDIAGTVESISQITPEILYKCHSAFYNPDNMILCVCGEASPESVLSVIDKVLADFKPVKVINHYETEERTAFAKKHERRMSVAKPLFCLGIKDIDISPDPTERMKKYAALQLICSIYFGKSSDFYGKLYEEGLISPSFSCWTQHNSRFSFFTASGDSSSPDEVNDRFLALIDKMSEGKIDRDDFERCRRAIYSRFIKIFDSTEDIANTLVTDFATDDGDIFEYAEIMKNITPEYAEEVMHSFFKKDAAAMSTVLPI